MKPLDDGLKQRVVGALVLLALAVIFIPVLFDRDPMPPVDRMSQIPTQPQIVTVEIGRPVVPEDVPAAPEPEMMYVPEETSEVNSLPEPPGLVADGTPRGWVLQVASFRQGEHAAVLRDKLNARGFTAYMREVQHKDAAVIRVYVGPKLDKQSLLADKETIEKEFALKSLVLPFTPE